MNKEKEEEQMSEVEITASESVLHSNGEQAPREPDCDFEGIPQEINLTFKVCYEDVMSGLVQTDKQDGTNRKNRIRYVLVMVVAALELVAFLQTQSGFALVFALVFLGLGIYMNKRSAGVNHRIATAFAQEEQQTFFVNSEQMELSGSLVAFDEVKKLFEMDDCFSMVYQRNRVYIIPKRLITQRERYGITRKLKNILGDTYKDCTTARE